MMLCRRGRSRLASPTSRVACVATSVAALACEGQAALTEHNPASSAVWWVSGTIFLILVLILAIESFDWLHFRWRRLRGLEPPPDTFRPGRDLTEVKAGRTTPGPGRDGLEQPPHPP